MNNSQNNIMIVIQGFYWCKLTAKIGKRKHMIAGGVLPLYGGNHHKAMISENEPCMVVFKTPLIRGHPPPPHQRPDLPFRRVPPRGTTVLAICAIKSKQLDM